MLLGMRYILLADIQLVATVIFKNFFFLFQGSPVEVLVSISVASFANIKEVEMVRIMSDYLISCIL